MQGLRKYAILVLYFIVIMPRSQALCPSSGSIIINQMSSELIKANDGVTFRGARVSWTFDEDYRNCNLAVLSISISIIYPATLRRYYIDITFRDNSVELINLVNDCNSGYRFVIIFGQKFSSHRYLDTSTSLFYGGSVNSVPSTIPRVFTGPDVLDPKIRLSIFWDPLPCHLQNGADISDYIIQYRIATTTVNETRSISVSDNRLDCIQEPVGPYRCYLTHTLLLENQTYILQVAAVNSYGIGPFSDPVNATLYSQGMPSILCTSPPITAASTLLTPKVSESLPEITNCTKSDEIHSNEESSQVTIAWILAGSQIAIVTGVVIIVLSINCLLWKRMQSTSQHIKLQKRGSDEMHMADCVAYGRTSSKPEEAVYESTA